MTRPEDRIAALEGELAQLKALLAAAGIAPPSPPPPAPAPAQPPEERVPIGRLVGYRARPSWVWGAVGLVGALPDERLTLPPEEGRRVGALASLAAQRGRWEGALEELRISPPAWEASAQRISALRPYLRGYAQALLEAVESRLDIPEPVRSAAAAALRGAIASLE